MTLARYLKALSRLWPIVLLTMLLGIGLGVGSAMLMPKSYEAQTTIFVNVSESATVQDLQMGEQFAQSRAASYAAIGTSSEVLDPVSADVGEDVSEAVTVTNAPNTATLSVSATDSDAERAAEIAQGVSESLVEQAASLEGSTAPEDSPVQLSIVDEAQVPAGPSSPSTPLNTLVGAVVGLVIGLLIVLARASARMRGIDS